VKFPIAVLLNYLFYQIVLFVYKFFGLKKSQYQYLRQIEKAYDKGIEDEKLNQFV
jgi:hypothetical protein